MAWTSKGNSRRPVLKQAVFRSRLEDRIATQLEEAGIPFAYEAEIIPYTVPSRKAKYKLDFLLNSKIRIESKGYFDADDRKKMLQVRDSNPDLDIRFVFQRANNKIHKASPTTYAAWCEQHGFKWADKGEIPQQWLDEAMQ